MRFNVRYCRFVLGRWLIHLGLKVLPYGRVKNELSYLITKWGVGVYAEVFKSNHRPQT